MNDPKLDHRPAPHRNSVQHAAQKRRKIAIVEVLGSEGNRRHSPSADQQGVKLASFSACICDSSQTPWEALWHGEGTMPWPCAFQTARLAPPEPRPPTAAALIRRHEALRAAPCWGDRPS